MRQLKISKSITNRESPSLGKYLQEINKVGLLTNEEEVRLAILTRKGDKRASDQLIKANLRFVISVAKQFHGQGLSLSDLINEGNFGLIKAAQKFDETRGFKFISFAVWWIRQSILDALGGNARLVRLPMNKIFLSSRIRKAEMELEQQLERKPTTDELAEALNINIGEVSDSISHSSKHISLDSPANDSEEGSLLDVIENTSSRYADEEMVYGESLKKEISRTLNELPEKQRETLCFFYGIGVERPMSLEDIARKYDLTVERVRQIKDAGISKLKSHRNINVLRSFLGV